MKKIVISLLLLLFSAAASAEQAFVPAAAGTKTIAATGASAAMALATSPLTATAYQVELQNAGTATVFVEFGTSSGVTAAVATGYPVLAGQSKLVTVSSNTTHIATITGGAAVTVYATVGAGE